MSCGFSVARWIGIEATAWRPVVIRIGHGSGPNSRSPGNSSAAIVSTSPSSPAGDAGKGQRRERSANDVDKYRCRSISSRKVSFEHIDVESQLVTLELG